LARPITKPEEKMKGFAKFAPLMLAMLFPIFAILTSAQVGNSGTIEGVVQDPSGGAIAGARVEISYIISGFRRDTTSAADGSFRLTNIPFNTYHAVVAASGFASFTQDVDVRSTVPTKVEFTLKINTEVTSVTVTEKGGDLIETESTFHTDVDRGLFD